MKEYCQLQKLLFCDNERLEDDWEMFCRGSRPVYERQEKRLLIGAGQTVDFCTYFNSFSLEKWRKYTWMEELILRLEVRGEMEVALTGYVRQDGQYIRRTLYRRKIYAFNREELCLVYPSGDLFLAGFEIRTMSVCTIFAGAYVTRTEPEKRRPVSLHLVTTTCRKEDYILSNLRLLKETLYTDPELAENLWIHVVDNGRTLPVGEIEDSHIQMHPNLNAGGSGGFARGMMEAMAHPAKPTHILLMDDDILLLPESLCRTWRLLTLIRPEYERYFISGAMLDYEKMYMFYEDVGYVHGDGEFGPVREPADTRTVRDVLALAEDVPQPRNAYAGWWFCCIPAEFITEKNLPLPLFVRGDDVEFSLRCHGKFITMNGICVWHKGFTNKFSGAMEFYQVHRNSLIIQAVGGVCPEVDFMGRIWRLVRTELLRFDYNGAELLLDAVEDYLKGWTFLTQNQGETILREKSAKNERLSPLSGFPEAPVRPKDVYQSAPRTALETFLYRITYNGHFWPDRLRNKSTGVTAYDWFYNPHDYFLRKKLLAVNSYMKTGAYREIDRKRFLAILKRRRRLKARCRRTWRRVSQEYAQHGSAWKTAAFWKDYLKLTETDGPERERGAWKIR
ncbi:MAG: glycosyltransferase family 2 protein [Clostridiales bacterium]|nr:glycosyltransferase family 2 protein [Clostridiales bacterium]